MPPGMSRPTFAVSAVASRALSAGDLFWVADEAHLDGIELDLTSRLPLNRQPRLRTGERLGWVSSIVVPSGGASNSSRMLEAIQPFLAEDRRTTIVVQQRGGNALSDSSGVVRMARQLSMEISDQAHVAISITAGTRGAAGRAHLDRIKALRSVAAEWDFWLAFDLADCSDWQWEAEAAVYLAASRLSVIRVTLPMPTFDSHVRARLTERTLAASVDAGFTGVYSLAPSLLPWRWRHRATLAAKCEEGRALVIDLMRKRRSSVTSFDSPTRSPR